MANSNSIYWHDYETFGSDPRKDRACQFAGIRTDEDLTIIGDPLVIYCRPALDVLPDPEACLVTGITPQTALEKGLSEVEFSAQILAEFSEPQTCVAGFNSVRFDDEVTRHLLYRCFYDPYEREWKNDNSRWDIIDLLRMCYALRPEGFNWPTKPEGTPSFRLEEFTSANNIAHEGAHDALADVYATIAVAKLIKTKQPKLYDFYYSKRKKNSVLPMFNLAEPQPLIHISSMYPASKGCMAIVIPIMLDPSNSNGIIVYDLSSDPSSWLGDSIESIKERIFTSNTDLPKGVERIALKTVHVNKCPALAPLSVLTDEINAKFQIDLKQCELHQQQILEQEDLQEKLNGVFKPDFKTEQDPDLMLYSGGFFDGHDKSLFSQIRLEKSESLGEQDFDFHDKRLSEMLFRYRCRNYLDCLTIEEFEIWRDYCRKKFLTEDSEGLSQVSYVKQTISTKLKDANPQQKLLLEQLSQYIGSLCEKLEIEAE
ncbi:MAG: exodeoxyribonuclease I [Gammaproteobacteria bacterium]|nr:exodeoxyribonuclease I [Gammaproteobacteria bacterium]